VTPAGGGFRRRGRGAAERAGGICGALEPVTAAICQLARNLDQHGPPVIDYARRRRQSRLCHAPLDAGSWRSQRDLLLAQHGRRAPRRTSSSPGSA
jgi:hypothetical protein